MRGSEPQELRDALAVRRVLAHPFLQHLAERLPERRVLLLLVLGQVLEELERAARAARADRLDVAALLQDLARDVERQVVRVHDAAHEPQVRRQQVLGVVHDEHAPDVELEPAAVVAVPEVERRVRRDVEKLRVLLPALDPVVGPGERRVEVVGDVAVERLVLLVRDLALRPRPERARLVDGLLQPGRDRFLLLLRPFELLHHDRDGDVVGILAQDRLEPRVGEEVVLAGAQMQDHVGAAGGLLDRFDGVLAGTVGFPAHALARRPSGRAA